jgi:hypothetical protein
MVTDALDRGRAAFAREAWAEAYAALSEADRAGVLGPEDLDLLATSAYLIGDDEAAAETLSRAHHGFLQRGDSIRAARSAFWLAFLLIDRPTRRAQAGGWLARAQRLIDDSGRACAERGFLLCALSHQRVSAGDLAGAHEGFTSAAEIGVQFGDLELIGFARHGMGRTLLKPRSGVRGTGDAG